MTGYDRPGRGRDGMGWTRKNLTGSDRNLIDTGKESRQNLMKREIMRLEKQIVQSEGGIKTRIKLTGRGRSVKGGGARQGGGGRKGAEQGKGVGGGEEGGGSSAWEVVRGYGLTTQLALADYRAE